MAIAPGQHLAQYRLIERIGAGGMGEVWKAVDERLDRLVAVKVLPDEVADDRDRIDRFAREAKLLAALNHPNVVTLYNVEEADGRHFLVMEFVAGVTLDRRIPASGLALRPLLDLALPLVRAVAAAHRRGITHRDLKPGNVIVGDDGRLRVLDFGLAKLIRGDASPAGASRTMTADVTRPGSVLGTWAYMSPEQAEGLAVDARSDVFSLGVLLYEMATGRRPFVGDNPARLLSSILRDTPPPIAKTRVDLPQRLSEVVTRCLDKESDSRWADAGQLEQALEALDEERSAVGTRSALERDERQSIAVLPFANLSSDPGDEVFSDGVTEEIINALSTVKGLRVAARTSAFSFKGKAVDVAEIAGKLNVAHVLEGSVRKAGRRLRITAQLVDVSDGCQIWSERFDREMDDIFAIQDEIASAIAGKFEDELGPRSGSPLVKSRTRNMDAYEAYLQGRQAWLRFGASTYEGLEHCKRAVELDPDFALAWSGVAEAYGTLGFTGAMDPRVALPLSREAAEQALALDESLSEAHCALGHYKLVYERDWPAAEASLLRAIELNPNAPQALHHYGHLYDGFVVYRLDEGIELCRRAAEVDPFGGFPKHGWLANLYIAGRLDEAIERLSRELEQDPAAFHLRRLLGLCLLERDGADAARPAIEEAVRSSGRHPWAVAELGSLHARAGQIETAEAFQAELLARSRTGYVQGTVLAMIPTNLGRFDEAYEWLERAEVEFDPIIFAMTTWPTVRRLREDPRFLPFLKRLNLDPPPGP